MDAKIIVKSLIKSADKIMDPNSKTTISKLLVIPEDRMGKNFFKGYNISKKVKAELKTEGVYYLEGMGLVKDVN